MIPDAGTWCTVVGRSEAEETKGQRRILYKFLLSCHKNMTFISQSHSMETVVLALGPTDGTMGHAAEPSHRYTLLPS